MHRKCLVDAATHVSVFATASRVPLPAVNSALPKLVYMQLLEQFACILRPANFLWPIKHDFTHHITTTGPPGHARARRLPHYRCKIARGEFEHILELGIVRPSSSPYASPLHLMPKASPGDWMPCGEYCMLNAAVPDHFPLPHIADFSAPLHGATIYSKIDLVNQAYHQIPVAPADIPRR